jgi:AcrR family transcriptional regulator
MSATPRTRLRPAQRREQLLDLGVELMSVHRLEDLSIDVLAEEAGISRGLLYHYFTGKRDFHLAVLRRMAEQVYSVTAPDQGGSPLDQLAGSLLAFVDFVGENREAYESFVRAAAAGDAEYQQIYENARASLTDRIFEQAGPEVLAGLGIVDTPAVRLLVHGWSALVEDTVLTWLDDPRGLDKHELVGLLARALAGVGALVSPTQ